MSDSASFKKSIIGAACVAGVGALAILIYKQLGKQETAPVKKNVQPLSKVTTIKVLKLLKKEFFTAFQTMSVMAQQIKQQAQGRASPEEIKEFVLMQPQIKADCKNSENRVYKRLNITEQDFQNAITNLFGEDQDVQKHRQELKLMFDKAASGAQLEVKSEIPQSLTSQNTLTIIEEIMRESCKKMQETFAKIKEEQGQLDLNDPQTIQALNNMRVDDVKQEILEKHGLDQYDDPGAKILSYASQTYANQNVDGFRDKMMELEMKHQQAMQAISTAPDDGSQVDSIFNKDMTAEIQQMQQMQGMGMGMGAGAGGLGPMGARRRQKEQAEKIIREEETKVEEAAKVVETKVEEVVEKVEGVVEKVEEVQQEIQQQQVVSESIQQEEVTPQPSGDYQIELAPKQEEMSAEAVDQQAEQQEQQQE